MFVFKLIFYTASERTEQSGISGTGDILPDPYNNILNLLGDQQQQQQHCGLGECRAQSGECCSSNDGSNGDIECPWSGCGWLAVAGGQ